MTKRQERGRARIAAILDTAEHVITDHGWSRTTTNRVAQEAGISPGSLYQYFGNKEEIAEALLGRAATALRTVHEDSREAIRSVADEGLPDSAWDAHVAAVTAPLLRFHARHPWFAILWRSLDEPSPARNALLELEQGMVTALDGLLEDLGVPPRAEGGPSARALLLTFRGFVAFGDVADQAEDPRDLRMVLSAYLNRCTQEESA
ncbi:MAG: helix-turn-helix domain-containing protein [Micrococcus sp.]|nr:helix-turn-helix domain-containing protein [Micrococcus sp.]